MNTVCIFAKPNNLSRDTETIVLSAIYSSTRRTICNADHKSGITVDPLPHPVEHLGL